MATVSPLDTEEMIEAMRIALERREEDLRRGYASIQTIARDLLFFTMAINTGLRPSDLIKLPADINFWAGNTFRVKMQKTSQYTEVGIGGSLRDALDHYFEVHENIGEFLFYSTIGGTHNNGGHVTRQWCWDFFKKWSARANIVGRFGGTTGRRTCATFIYLTTGKIEYAQAILGHKDSATTLRYIRVIQEQALKYQGAISL